MNLTCVFKVHNPSAHKRAVIEHALNEYTVAYQGLLDWARDHQTVLREHGLFRDRYNGRAIGSVLPRTECPLHSSAKDGLIVDVAGNLASYFALKDSGADVSFPTARNPEPEAYSHALDDFIAVGSDEGDYNESRNRLATLARGQYMPLFFSRPDGATQNRNFSLLVHSKKRQLFAALWLLPARHGLGKSINANGGDLLRIDTGEIFSSNSTCAILVPLQVGRNGWHEERFLIPAIEGRASTKAAFLAKRDEEYFLHVIFEVECPDAYPPEGWIGIDKGILFTAAYAAIDSAGAVLELGHFDDELRALQLKHGKEREIRSRNGKAITRRDYKQKAYDNILHILANTLIDKARDNQAGIAVEDLNVMVKGSRVVSRFRKFDHILEYKCKLAGVPFRRVFAAYSSVICHRCGEDVMRDDRQITCSHCGYAGHSDDNAAVNIARRVLYRKADWDDGYRGFHRSFKIT